MNLAHYWLPLLLSLISVSLGQGTSKPHEQESITYGELKQRALEGKILINTNTGLADDQRLVKIGYHGTLQQFAESIVSNGIQPSKKGVLGPGVYVTPNLGIAMFYAAASNARTGNKVQLDYKTSTDSVCHVFLPEHVLDDITVRELKHNDVASWMNILEDTIGHEDTTIVLSTKKGNAVDQVKLPEKYAKKTVSLCESVAPYRSTFRKYRKTFSLMALRLGIRKSTSYVRKFEKQSALSDMKMVDFLTLAQKHREAGVTWCNLCKAQKDIPGASNVVILPGEEGQAKYYVTAIPRSHQPAYLVDLTRDHIDLVKSLKQACIKHFEQQGYSTADAVYGFILPMKVFASTLPEHLQMHCLMPPIQEVLLTEESPVFITADKVIQKLAAGKRIQYPGIFKTLRKMISAIRHIQKNQ